MSASRWRRALAKQPRASTARAAHLVVLVDGSDRVDVLVRVLLRHHPQHRFAVAVVRVEELLDPPAQGRALGRLDGCALARLRVDATARIDNIRLLEFDYVMFLR